MSFPHFSLPLLAILVQLCTNGDAVLSMPCPLAHILIVDVLLLVLLIFDFILIFLLIFILILLLLLILLILIILLLLIVLSPQAQRSPLQARQRLHQDTVGRNPDLKLQQNLRKKKCLFISRWDPAGLLTPRGQPPLETRGETRASLVSFLLTPPFFSSSI